MNQKQLTVTLAATLMATFLAACGGEPEDGEIFSVETATDTSELTPLPSIITPADDPECAWGAGAASAAPSRNAGNPSPQASCTSSNCWSNGAIQYGCAGSCSHQHCGCGNQTVCCGGVCSVKYICRWGSCHNGC